MQAYYMLLLPVEYFYSVMLRGGVTMTLSALKITLEMLPYVTRALANLGYT